MELEVEGRRPVGRQQKTWSKVKKEDMKNLNVTEVIVEDRKQWTGGNSYIMSNPRSGKIETINEEEEEEDDNE